MGRAPFPKPGERLVDPSPREARHESRPRVPNSIYGSVGYGPAHPGRWAGRRPRGTARLTVEGETILIQPLWWSRPILRFPAVRIPFAEITSASRTTFGIWFHAPNDPELNGTRFTPFLGYRTALVELLRARGVPVNTMPVSSRMRRSIENGAVAARPGLIWRDRGPFSVIESVVYLAIMVIGLYLFAHLSTAPRFFVGLLALILVLRVVGWIVGSWRRKKALAAYRDDDRAD
jgi:hypothetical protein